MNQPNRWEDLPPDPLDELATEPLPAPFSEDALTVIWTKRHSKNWRYCAEWNAWIEWTGDRWRQDKTNEVFELCRNVTRELLLLPDITKGQARAINSATTAAGIMRFLKADRHISATPEQFDTDPMLFGVPGGVLDLNISKLIESERSQYITKQAAVAPAPGEPTRWLAFLDTVTAGSRDITDFLQRFAGYCLTGQTSEHALAFLYGSGANGKTVFTQTMLGIMGEYAITTPPETFTETKTERHSTELARLRGARLVATEETSSGSRWNESRIKILTGGNTISARRMRCDDESFMPTFKLLISGNHKPMMRSVDEAMKRRMNIVPFTVTIPEQDRDRDLLETLKTEWPQILNWMLAGCAAWRDYGLATPEEIRTATDTYLQAEDTLNTWLDECCERTGLSDGKVLYNSFTAWCEQQGEHVWARRTWSNAMIDKGFTPKRSAKARMFEGVRVRVGDAPPARYAD